MYDEKNKIGTFESLKAFVNWYYETYPQTHDMYETFYDFLDEFERNGAEYVERVDGRVDVYFF